MKKLYVFALITILSGLAFGQTKKIESIYTSTSTNVCKTLEQSDEGAGFYRGSCPGVGGYKLELIEGDIRQTLDVIAPIKKKFELNLWAVVSGAFSSIGEKVEWRVTKSGKTNVPKALIVRFNASEDPEDSTKITSYLVVVKITKTSVCVTDIVKPAANQNVRARELADVSQNKPCQTVE